MPKPKPQKATIPARWRTDQLPRLPRSAISEISCIGFWRRQELMNLDTLNTETVLIRKKPAPQDRFWRKKGLEALAAEMKALSEPLDIVFDQNRVRYNLEDGKEPETLFVDTSPLERHDVLNTSLHRLKLETLALLERRSRGLTRHVFYWCYRRDFLLPLIEQAFILETRKQERLGKLLDHLETVLDGWDHLDSEVEATGKTLATFFYRAVLRQLGEMDLVDALETGVERDALDDVIRFRIPKARSILAGDWQIDPAPAPVPKEFEQVEFSEDFKKIYFDGNPRVIYLRNGPTPRLLDSLYQRYKNYINEGVLRSTGDRPEEITLPGNELTRRIKDRPKDQQALIRAIIHVRKMKDGKQRLSLNTQYQYTLRRD